MKKGGSVNTRKMIFSCMSLLLIVQSLKSANLIVSFLFCLDIGV